MFETAAQLCASWSTLYTAPRLDCSSPATTSISTSFSATATKTWRCRGVSSSSTAVSARRRSATLPCSGRHPNPRRGDPRSRRHPRWGSDPGARRAAELHRDLEDDERVCPGCEAAGAAVAVELRRDGDDSVVGGLVAEVVELGAADLRVEVAATVRLGVRSSEQEVVQPFERSSALDSRGARRPSTHARDSASSPRARDRAAPVSI